MKTGFIHEGKLDLPAVTAALRQFLDSVLRLGRFDLSYTVRTEAHGSEPAGTAVTLEHPEVIVDFAGPDQGLLLERNAEALKALEYLSLRVLNFEPQFHDRVRFDSGDYRALRLEELKLAAKVAAARVCETHQPFRLNPMSSRERRVIHLVLKEIPGVRTSSEGMGDDRQVVIFPADKK
jgi:spoIIIJ-associated protein